MADFDSPASVAKDHIQAAQPDAERNEIAEHVLGILAAKGIPRAEPVRQVVYTLVNGVRSLGAINVALADVGLELGALVRATALAGLVQAQGAADTDAISPAVLTDLEAIAADLDPDGDDDEGGDPEGSIAGAIDQAAELLEQLDDEGRRALANALVDRTAGRAGLAELLDHFIPEGDAEGDDGE